MQYIVNQNIGTGSVKSRGSRHDIRYIATQDDVTAPLKGHHSRHGSARGSQELLASHPRGSKKNKKEFNQVVGLMDANLEALMVRDIQAASRRGSMIEEQRGRKPKR